MDPILITGLFSKKFRKGEKIPEKIVSEVRTSLMINKWYKEKLVFLAGDMQAANVLSNLGLNIYAIFDNAPDSILEKPAFRMKHWMVYQMLRRYPEVIWIDWDTISIKPLDGKFFGLCRQGATPKFVYIPFYHAVINCSVYYVPRNWLGKMKESFDAASCEANDERMWLSVLPKDIQEKQEFWWGDSVVNIWLEDEWRFVTSNTYFAHVKTFDYYQHLKSHHLLK